MKLAIPTNTLGRGGHTERIARGSSGPSPKPPCPARRRLKPVNVTVDADALGTPTATARNFIVRCSGMPVRFVTLDDWRSIFVVDYEHPTIFCSEEEARDIAWDYGMKPGSTEIKPI